MANFALLNNNVVVKVISVPNSAIGEPDASFPQTDANGRRWLNSNGFSGLWKQTSYNRSFRKNYAAVGYAYNPTLDAFVPPRPYPSWTLNESTCHWEPPTPRPAGIMWKWDEATQQWVEG